MLDYTKKHIKSLKPAATLAINEKCKALRAEGKKVFNFGFGGSPFSIPEKIVLALKNNAHKKEYLPSAGLKNLRETIAKYINLYSNNHFEQDDIIIGPGTKQLMFLLQLGFEGEFIFPTGSWVSYEPQAKIAKNKVHWIKTSRENNWFPKPEEIEKKIKSIKNKNIILFLNSPNNPSGQVCEHLDEISNIARKYNLIILSDEIYSELTFKEKYKSISNFCPEKTIISTGLSKWCGAGGWRLGYFIIPETLYDIKNSINVLASETFSAVSAPIQYAAIKAYENDYTKYINKSKNILSAVGKYVYLNLKSNNILINESQGGFYLMPEFLNNKFNSSSEMCDDILKKTGIALLPGSDFGFNKKRMLARLSFTDFEGKKLMKFYEKNNHLNDELIKQIAPKIAEGVEKLKKWSETI